MKTKMPNSLLKLNTALLLASVLTIAVQAHAEDKSTTPITGDAAVSTKIETVKPITPEIKSGESDVDDVITNRLLRAQTGAKSKYSFSTALSYNGGTINDPGSSVRPNIAATSFIPVQPSLQGSLGGKYKIDALQSLSLDVGVRIYKPFHTDPNKNFGQRTTIADPSLTYQVVYQTAGIQNVSSISGGVTTDEQYREIGTVGSVGVSQTAIYDFNGSRFSVGLAGEVYYTAFDKNANTRVTDSDGNVSSLGDQQSDYTFALYPFAELNLTDRLNLRTVFRPFNFEHVRSQAFGNVARNVYTQSFGLGISVARDLFLYPNIQFAPENLRSDRTNVGLTLNLNI